ncbi:MAG: hypothetical protein ACREIP_01500, partial [Alphaproteobacteria bacterium]
DRVRKYATDRRAPTTKTHRRRAMAKGQQRSTREKKKPKKDKVKSVAATSRFGTPPAPTGNPAADKKKW